MNTSVSGKKEIFSLFLAIIALHMYIIGLTTESIVLIVISIIDSLIAFLLGIRTNSDYGHAGLIIGVLVFMVSITTLLLVI